MSYVRLEGLDIRFRRGRKTPRSAPKTEKKPPHFVIDEMIADGTKLTTLPSDAWKEPLEFEIQHLRLYGGGPADADEFDAALIQRQASGRDPE